MLPRDPSRADLLAFLAPLARSYGADDSDIECAVYWYAVHFHGGRSTNLYGALCASPYRPGPLETWPPVESAAEMLYTDLIAETPES